MKILIVAATKQELEHLLSVVKIKTDLGGALIQTEHKNHKIDIIFTGVGMTLTAYYCAKTISDYYDIAINAGICGSFNKNLEIGTVVNVYEDCFSELGAEDGDVFLSMEEIGLNGVQIVQGSMLKVENTTIKNLPKVNGITVNTVHGKEKSIETVFNKFHPMTESMEGAAFMLVCEKEKMPSIQIRAVSNYVEKRNKENWNISLAIKNLNDKLLEIINDFK